MLKKSLALTMAFVMFICCFSFNISAADSDWAEYWEENKDKGTTAEEWDQSRYKLETGNGQNPFKAPTHEGKCKYKK